MVGGVLEKLSGGLVSTTAVDLVATRAAGTGSRIERSAAAAMLRPVRRRFEVGSQGLPTTLWDPSSTLSEVLFFPASEGGTERVGMGLAAKERGLVGNRDSVTSGEGERETAGEGARETAGEGAREAAGEGAGDGAQEGAGEEMGGDGDLDPAGDGRRMLGSALESRMGVCSGTMVEARVEFVLLVPAKPRESKSAPSPSMSMALRPLKPSSVGNALARHSSGAVFMY